MAKNAVSQGICRGKTFLEGIGNLSPFSRTILKNINKIKNAILVIRYDAMRYMACNDVM